MSVLFRACMGGNFSFFRFLNISQIPNSFEATINRDTKQVNCKQFVEQWTKASDCNPILNNASSKTNAKKKHRASASQHES